MFRLPPASCWKAAQGRVGQPSSAQMARSGGHSTLTVSHGLFSSLLVLLGKGEGDDSASLGGIFTILPPSSSPDTQAARLWIPSPSSLSSGPLFQFLPLPSLAKSKSQLGHSSSSDSSPSSPHLPPSPQSQCESGGQNSLVPQSWFDQSVSSSSSAWRRQGVTSQWRRGKES